MISDILFDAIHEIGEYEETDPAYYNGNLPELRVVLTIMDAMRTVLDTPPVSPYEERAERIAKAIREVDLSDVKAALESTAA